MMDALGLQGFFAAKDDLQLRRDQLLILTISFPLALEIASSHYNIKVPLMYHFSSLDDQ